MALSIDLHAVGIVAPGLDSLADLLRWQREGRATGPGVASPLPAPAALPANERRRASQVVRLTMACAERALQTSPYAADALRMVFASDEGTGEVCQQMLEALATSQPVSPLLFHNSVHNAPSGYLSIAYRNRKSATSVSLGAESFASGLLCAASEACTTGHPVLFLAYDPRMTEPMHELLPIGQPIASAWILSAGGTSAVASEPIASLELSLQAAASHTAPLLPAWLPIGWADSASAQSLVALAMLDKEVGPRRCEFPLGARRLRLDRRMENARC